MKSHIRVDKNRGRWRIIYSYAGRLRVHKTIQFKEPGIPGSAVSNQPGRCENSMMLACNLSLTDKSAHLKVTLTKQTLKQADTLFCILNTFSTRLVCQNF